MAEVLVTGGTGNLGSDLVPRLLAKGYGVRVLSRREKPNVPVAARAVRGDLTTGAGLEEALAGIDVLVHCASGTGTIRGLMYGPARKTDVEATQRMLALAAQQGARPPFVVYISIVGIDRIPLGYYRAKLETEKVIESSELPYTTLRTTQWHTLAWEFCKRLTSGPLVVVPKGVKSQLLDPSEVADRMVTLVEQGPIGMAPEMGGPEVLEVREIVESYLQALAKRRPVRAVILPGRIMRAFRAGHNLTPEHADGRIGWEEWLGRQAT